MTFSNIYIILKKEIKNYLTNPATYIIAGAFILIWEFLFFQNVFLIGEASVQGLFGLLTWFFLLLIPAITMGSIAEENNKETLEILLTHPLTDIELILGKFLSALAFIATLLLASLPVVITLNTFGDVDMGAYVGQYIAAVLLAGTFVSAGIAVSTFFKSQVPALMLSVIIAFILTIIGLDIVTMSLPTWIGNIFSRLSTLTHYSSISRGVLDLRDVWYFVLVTAIFLNIGHTRLMLRRSNKSIKNILNKRLYTLGLIIFLFLTSGLGFLPIARLDLTEGNIYTLTDATKNVLSNITEDIAVTLYVSDNLPAQYQPISRVVRDTLRDYAIYEKINVEYKNPDNDEDTAQEAQKAGVYPAQFNMVGDGEFQIKQSYFGITIVSGEEIKSIPLVQNTSDLEYKLTSFINELTNTEKKKIVFLYSEDEESRTSNYSTFVNELSKQFVVEDFILSEATTTVPDDIDAIVITGTSAMFTELKANSIRTAISDGKNMFFMVDAISANPQYMIAMSNGTSTDNVLEEYGITVNNDLVYDLRANKTAQVGGNGGFTYILPYPPFVQATIVSESLTGSKIPFVVVPWGSSISVNDETLNSKNLISLPLVHTTKYAGAETSDFDINPQRRFPETNLGIKNLGILIKPKEDVQDKTRMIVMGDSDLLTDSSASVENIAFGMEVVSYLAQEDSLAGIKIKQNTSRPLMFETPNQTTLVHYGNMAGVIVVIIVVGTFIIGKRRKLRKMTYEEGKNK